MFDSNYYPYYKNRHFFNKKINFSKFLDGAQKTLNIINQSIPIIYQIKPLYENTKTAIKVMNAIKSDDSKENKSTINKVKEKETKKVEPNNSPTYFL